jgi:endonuclease/exonuclease/phosphatase family metal-dependent hydrolase
MTVTVGTFNLNNLFSRFNFRAEIPEDHGGDGTALQATYEFSDPEDVRVRRYQGRLVRGKDDRGRGHVARRLLASHEDILVPPPAVDVWAVQEVEDIDTLRFFAANDLGGRYPYVVLIEGNDPRLIDLAVLSRLPLGAVTSWQHAVHRDDPGRRVFGRDLLEVEVLDARRTRRLFTLFNTHLKSHFVPFGQDPEAGAATANRRRQRQAETVARIVAARTRPDSSYVVTGDMNDPPDSEWLAPFTASAELRLSDALTAPVETRPAKADSVPPAGPAWTHRFKESGQPPHYSLFDHIWLSPSLAAKHDGAWIVRRRTHAGEGSDHDPALVRLSL